MRSRFLLVSAALTAAVPSACPAQDNQVTNEYRVTVFPYFPIKGNLSGFGYLGYVRNPESRYELYYLGVPGVNYAVTKYFQVWGGFIDIYTNNFDRQDKLELRPFGAIKLFVPNKRKLNIYTFTRYEYRQIYDHGTQQWSHIDRVRPRFAVEFPLTSLEKAWKPKTFYGFTDFEAFYRFDKNTWDTMRLRAALGYITNHHFRVELIYHAQFGRPDPTDPFEYNENIIRLNIKIALKKGLFERVLDPRD